MEGYDTKLKDNWNAPISGSPMYIVWEKLKRMQAVMRALNKPLTTLNHDILKAREELTTTHHSLNLDLMDKDMIIRV